MRPNSKQRHAWLIAAAVAASVGLAWAPASAAGQPAPKDPPKTPAATIHAPNAEPEINQIGEEVELLRAQIEARQSLLKIAESRLVQARRWETHYQKLLADGKVTEDRYLSARDDVLMLEAHLAGEKADLKATNIRLKHAEMRVARGDLPASPTDSRLADIDHRMASMEMKIDRLQHEVGRLRREQKGESPTSHH